MNILKLVKTALRACALASLLWLPSGLAQMGGPALVKVAVASLKDIAPVTMVPGTVISRNDARISAETDGRITWVADVGQRIEAGEPVGDWYAMLDRLAK